MERTHDGYSSNRGVRGVACAVSLAVFTFGLPAFAQQAPPPYPAPPPFNGQQAPNGQPAAPAAAQPLLTPDQLDNLVAPIALYPDPLLGQVLAASTYPLEVVEAQQWLQQNGGLRGADLMNAARQQNWDPAIQALVAFPDVVATLNRDVRWTTDLGNAFLAQQQDVMEAVQRMRVRAQQNGHLSSNSQETVTTQSQNGQNAVVIEPSNPQVIYVPVYNPDYVWGPPAYGYYPPLWYPPVGYGFGFGPGIYLDAFFPGWLGFGWGGWGLGWGWGCGWFGGGLFLNAGFFNHWGYHGFYGGRFGGVGGRFAWEHDAFHRAGVAYANRGVAERFNNSRFASGRSFAGSSARSFNGGSSFASRGFASPNRGAGSAAAGGGGWQRFGGSGSASARGFAPSNGAQSYRGNAGAGYGGGARSYAAPGSNAYRGGFNGNTRSYSPGSGFSGSARSFSGGGFNGGARSFSGGGSSGGRSFGGGGGGHSFGGGGGHSGGGGHGGGHR